ncbi:unnamed protein product, partial [Ectocarpus fasciculatus]
SSGEGTHGEAEKKRGETTAVVWHCCSRWVLKNTTSRQQLRDHAWSCGCRPAAADGSGKGEFEWRQEIARGRSKRERIARAGTSPD